MSCLINDAKTERIKLVENALAISLLDAGEPTEKTRTLVDQYINGEMNLEEVKNRVLKMYQQETVN